MLENEENPFYGIRLRDPYPSFFSDGQILSENRILGYFRFLIDLLECA